MTAQVQSSCEKREGCRIERELELEQYFSYLLQQYEKLVYSICYRTCGNPFDAQDLTQDTFLAVYKHLGTFDRQYERAWVCRIASNKAIDYMKSRKRLEECREQEFFIEMVDSRDGPEEAYIQKETKELVLSVCNQLKSPYREVAYEHFYLEKPMPQIAEEQQTNLKTVQTRVYRARAQIRKLMEGRDHASDRPARSLPERSGGADGGTGVGKLPGRSRLNRSAKAGPFKEGGGA